ncbi:hypothetical protein L2E82_23128 [Cichorium intybus]|uniref:Uncharacterized protein n=1 Tax=Cichorium intybus TaxID=13427 RepID=A0ACB9E0D3_CICIN|nr:hypothetical protein L2E82_23128 [Cichorium intybus]
MVDSSSKNKSSNDGPYGLVLISGVELANDIRPAISGEGEIHDIMEVMPNQRSERTFKEEMGKGIRTVPAERTNEIGISVPNFDFIMSLKAIFKSNPKNESMSRDVLGEPNKMKPNNRMMIGANRVKPASWMSRADKNLERGPAGCQLSNQAEVEHPSPIWETIYSLILSRISRMLRQANPEPYFWGASQKLRPHKR